VRDNGFERHGHLNTSITNWVNALRGRGQGQVETNVEMGTSGEQQYNQI